MIRMMYGAIALAAILESKCDDVGGQCRFVIRCLRDLAMRGPMLTKNLACPSFGHAKFVNHMYHRHGGVRGLEVSLCGLGENHLVQRAASGHFLSEVPSVA